MNLPVIKLPHMKCDPGCGYCCGPVICQPEEFDRIREAIAARGIVPVRQGVTCPLFIGGYCSVYDVRPFACRLFGHVPTMVCNRGHNANIPEKREERLMREYTAAGRPDRWLHSLVMTEDELLGLLAAEFSQ